MGSSLSILRLFSVLAVFMALVISLFGRQVGAAVAQGAADAAAIAVTDLLPPDWTCAESDLPSDALATASRAAAGRAAQLASVTPTAVEVRTDGTCSVIVSVRVASHGWLATAGALGVACRRPSFARGAALQAPLPPPC
ncbi:hypothetical protein [Candidatus Poriferisodalis sp.]|uniref:hypothetical protein n=1 Tax=Candidatus Poriferisodalis sp. TaxID=3101277 RepID=UPI003B02BA0C